MLPETSIMFSTISEPGSHECDDDSRQDPFLDIDSVILDHRYYFAEDGHSMHASAFLSEFDGDIDCLVATVENNPVEDGITHDGEGIAGEIVAVYGAEAFVEAIFNIENEPIVAALLRIASRLSLPDAASRFRLVSIGVRYENVEIRDASIQAAESWEDDAVLPVLIEHEEPVRWLADYIRQVIDELRR